MSTADHCDSYAGHERRSANGSLTLVQISFIGAQQWCPQKTSYLQAILNTMAVRYYVGPKALKSKQAHESKVYW